MKKINAKKIEATFHGAGFDIAYLGGDTLIDNWHTFVPPEPVKTVKDLQNILRKYFKKRRGTVKFINKSGNLFENLT